MTASVNVRANPDRLPPRWWLDPDYAERVRGQIVRLRRDGYELNAVASQVGVSQRAVVRTLKHERDGTLHHCKGETRYGDPCTRLCIAGGDGYCAYHARNRGELTAAVICGAPIQGKAARKAGWSTCHRPTRSPSGLCYSHERTAA
jgi:hypothetical protein